jgi:acetylornithine deacetylase/succinyl-diaminopimelate desuccinylase-like protein
MTRALLDPIDLLEELVRIDSVNPAMGGPGEHEIARRLAEIASGFGLQVSTPGAVEGRPNLIARLPGEMDAPSLLLEAHLDTVGMPVGGFPVTRTPDRLTGRGACDTKGSCAAMVAALSELVATGDHGEVIFAGVVDEEYMLRGSRLLVEQLPSVDAAVVGEPISLAPVRVHNGLVRFRIVTHGRAAHTSRAHLGVNAIASAARVVTAIEERLLPLLSERVHPLAGPALLTTAVIRGGTAGNVVPDRCEITVDRRLAPGEGPEDALGEVDAVLNELRGREDEIAREEPFAVLPAVETPSDSTIVVLAERAVESVLGRRIPAEGVSYGTDASNLSGFGGIPCVVLGPGSIDQAHTDDEWVSVEEVRQAAAVYAEMARRFARLPVLAERSRKRPV